jgi:hypothetical protein
MKKAIIFKDGKAMVERTFSVCSDDVKRADDGSDLFAYTMALPSKPLFGTLEVLINSPPDAYIHSIVSKEAKKNVEQDCASICDILEANVGNAVKLRFSDHSELFLSSIVRVNKVSTSILSPSARSPSFALAAAGSSSGEQGLLFGLDLDNVSIVLPLRLIEAVSAGQGASSSSSSSSSLLKYTVTKERVRSALVVRVGGGKPPEQVTLRYMTTGITWVPSYTLDLIDNDDDVDDEKRATLNMRATILNDIETDTGDEDDGKEFYLDDCSCIAGFPNVRFSGVTDPLAGSSTIEQFFNELSRGANSPPGGPRAMSNRMVMQQAQAPPQAFGASSYGSLGGGDVQLPASMQKDNDLYHYRFHSVSVPKGGRTSLQVLRDHVVTYEDLYEVVVPASNSWSSNGYAQQQSPTDEKPTYTVYHFLKIKNSSAVPWTTAPVAVFRGGEFMSQDQMHYVPAGADARVKITKALSVIVDCDERTLGDDDQSSSSSSPSSSSSSSFSTSLLSVFGGNSQQQQQPQQPQQPQPQPPQRHRQQQQQSVTINHQQYRQYSVGVTLKLHNAATYAVSLKLTKHVNGIIDHSTFSTQPSDVKQPPRLTLVNPTQTVEFQVDLESRSRQQLYFQYVVLVRS